MLDEHAFHLAGVDVQAPDDNQFLFTPDDVQVAFLILTRQIAGEEPAMADDFFRLGGAVEIALHDVVAFNGQFADLSAGDGTAIVGNELDGDAGEGMADAADLPQPIRRVHRDHRGSLRQPVPFDQFDIVRLLESLPDFRRQRGASTYAELQIRQARAIFRRHLQH